MNVKNILIIISAFVLLSCGIALYDSDDSGATESSDPVVNEVNYNGFKFLVDNSTIAQTPATAYMIGYDESIKELKIPSVVPARVDTGETDVSGNPLYADIECKIIIDDKFNFKNNTSITSVVFEKGDYPVQFPTNLFTGCSSLEYVEINQPIEVIPTGMFSGCTNMSKIVLPVELTEIGEFAFIDCISLKDVNFESLTSLQKISTRAFQKCVSLTKVDLSNSVVNYIGKCAFTGSLATDPNLIMMKIDELILPDCLTIIGSHAFDTCVFKTINVPNDIQPEKLWGFGCNRVTIHTWPETLEEFVVSDESTYCSTYGDGCVYNKEGDELILVPPALKEYKLPAEVKSINRTAFPYTSIEKITLNESITELNNACFENCHELLVVENLQNINTINGFGCLFQNCTSLEFADISGMSTHYQSKNYIFENVATSYGMFWGCTSLTSVKFNPNSESIRAYSFVDCSNFYMDEYPESITEIGDEAFRGCEKIDFSYLPSSFKEIGKNAFYGTKINISSVGTSDSIVDLHAQAFYGCDEIVDLDLTYTNILANPDKDGLIARGANLKSVKYPESFETKIVINNGFETSEDGKKIYNYLGKGPVDVYVPNDVTLSSMLFQNCDTLVQIEFQDGRTNPHPIGYMFENCSNLEKAILNDVGGSRRDYKGAFFGCESLCFVQIDDDSKIYSSAFNGNRSDHLRFKFCGSYHPSSSELLGHVWVGNGDYELYKIAESDAVNADENKTYEIPIDLHLTNNVTLTGITNISGSITLGKGAVLSVSDKASLTGDVCASNNMFSFDEYSPTEVCTLSGSDIIVASDDAVKEFEKSRVNGVFISGFTDGGKSVIVDLSTYTEGIPDGKVLIQYSVYTEVDGELFLDPFKVVAVDVEGAPTIVAPVGDKVVSCVASYCYDFGGKLHWAPVSGSAGTIPADFISIDAPEEVSLTVDGTAVEDGDYLAFGRYVIEVAIPEGTQYTLNGKPTEEIDTLVYYGQDLVFALVTQE